MHVQDESDIHGVQTLSKILLKLYIIRNKQFHYLSKAHFKKNCIL